ncbi:MAG: ribonuclease J [Oscillospiraceae bacterium]|jgi:ribonuclease J|nr:ribonuclease J [Oscillospiraceae bacterium]
MPDNQKSVSSEKKQTEIVVKATKRRKPAQKKQIKTLKNASPLKIIPLGGLNEIGKNLTVFQTDNDIFLVDCGIAFPDYETPGVDVIIPDFTYLERNADKIKGIVITHGHEDHIGGIPFFLKKINVPVYGSALTLGLLEHKLKENNILSSTKLHQVKAGDIKSFGSMSVEFINVNHSIPESLGLAITTPAGIVVHTGDFKIDYTPINSDIIDLKRFGELGNKGVLALMSDSTNAERGGFTASERTVGDSFERLFHKAEGKRIIVATFASNVHRIQQIINCAEKNKRKVALFGRSMLNTFETATRLKCLKCPKNTMIETKDMAKYPDEKIVLITTGSQGEPLSALTRMASNDHRQVRITCHDYVILSANPIPGNEKHVTRVINDLMKSGADVVYEGMYEVHVSGHACQEELKLMLALTRPKFFIPVHGEYKHLTKHAKIANVMGIPEENIVVPALGNVIETDGDTIKVVSQVVSGSVYVDGNDVGGVGSIVLRDRKQLSQDGVIVVVVNYRDRALRGVELISRGFVYVRENEELMDNAKVAIIHSLNMLKDCHEWGVIKKKVSDALSEFVFQTTKRSPIILPVVIES